MDKLTIFYDGQCPLCSFEMHKLKQRDAMNNIRLVNLHQKDFSTTYPHINKEQAMAVLHGEYRGEMLFALDVTHRAWTLVGKGFWVAPLQFPIIKPIAHCCYLLMAKYRHSISSTFAQYFNIKVSKCSEGTCYETRSRTDHRRK